MSCNIEPTTIVKFHITSGMVLSVAKGLCIVPPPHIVIV